MTRADVKDMIREIISGYTILVDPEGITNEMHIRSDLGLDSLDIVELVIDIERECEIAIDDRKFLSLGDDPTIDQLVERYYSSL